MRSVYEVLRVMIQRYSLAGKMRDQSWAGGLTVLGLSVFKSI